MLDFELAHAVEKNIERDAKEFVAYNDVWVGFVECIEDVREEGTFVRERMDNAFLVGFGEGFKVRRVALERTDVGVYSAWKGFGWCWVVEVN